MAKNMTDAERQSNIDRAARLGFNCDSARRAFKKGMSVERYVALQQDTGLSVSEELGAWRPLRSTDIVDPKHVLPFDNGPMIPARRYGPDPESTISLNESASESEPTELTAGVEALTVG